MFAYKHSIFYLEISITQCHYYVYLLFVIPPPQNKDRFTDPDFPPADKSLYINPNNPVSYWKVYRWNHPQDVVDPHSYAKTKWEVLRNPGPDDIAQGVLGNCW